MMVDRTSGRGQGTGPIYWTQDMMDGITGQARTGEARTGQGAVPTNTNTDYNREALLVQVVDLGLRLHIAETPLGRMKEGLTLLIGRQAGVDLLLDEGSVSRQHAEISYAGGHYLLRDLGSTSGTFVNEQLLDASRLYVLQPNDILRFGNIVRLKFLLRALSYPIQTQPVHAQINQRDKVILPSDTTVRMPMLDDNAAEPSLVGVVQTSDTGHRVDARHDPYDASAYQEQLKKAPALIIVAEKSAQNGIPPQIHSLNPGQRITIGREEDNTIILTDATASRHHAEVFLDARDGNNVCYIRDLQSTYGTLVNQTRIAEPYLLSHGDRIKLGSTRIFYVDQQAGREQTTKFVGIRMGTRVTQNTVGLETNVIICPQCGVANARVARFCASCSALIVG